MSTFANSVILVRLKTVAIAYHIRTERPPLSIYADNSLRWSTCHGEIFKVQSSGQTSRGKFRIPSTQGLYPVRMKFHMLSLNTLFVKTDIATVLKHLAFRHQKTFRLLKHVNLQLHKFSDNRWQKSSSMQPADTNRVQAPVGGVA